jgi:D-arabinose 5-phosphate isomerase GutQ
MENKEANEARTMDILYRGIVTDLVTLAIKANDVVIKGSFSGADSDSVNSLLKMCKEIHDEYVTTDNE